MTDLEIRQLQNERDYYKRAYQSQKAQLDKLPKGSFIALQLERLKERGEKYSLDLKMYIDDHTSVRINNRLLEDYHRLCEMYTGGKCQYIEEGILKREGGKYDQ